MNVVYSQLSAKIAYVLWCNADLKSFLTYRIFRSLQSAKWAQF